MSNFAAEIVVKVTKDGRYNAGFASQIVGRKVRSYGKWYGCQMSYAPFNRAMTEAHMFALEMNQLSEPEQKARLESEPFTVSKSQFASR